MVVVVVKLDAVYALEEKLHTIASKMYYGAGIRAELRKYTIRGLAHRDLAKCDRDLAVS